METSSLCMWRSRRRFATGRLATRAATTAVRDLCAAVKDVSLFDINIIQIVMIF
jgi:hypothetical protein